MVKMISLSKRLRQPRVETRSRIFPANMVTGNTYSMNYSERQPVLYRSQ
jgi:hypothetical protein